MDDMLIISTNINVVNDTKKYLTLKFKMKNLNEVDTILGIKIRKHSGSFVLCQSHYIDKVLNKFNHLNIKVANTSNVVSCKLIENTGRSIAQIEYASVIGSLIYVMHCNISHFRDKTTISCQSKNRVINFFCIYIYIFTVFVLKSTEILTKSPFIPEGPKLLTWNLFTLLIARIS